MRNIVNDALQAGRNHHRGAENVNRFLGFLGCLIRFLRHSRNGYQAEYKRQRQ